MGAVDFDSIFNVQRTDISRLQRVSGGNDVVIPLRAENPPGKLTEAQTDPPESRTRLQREADRRKLERDKYLQGLADYQEAIQRAGGLRSEILHGIQQGDDPLSILLKACECISKQTGEAQFYRQAKEDIHTIYGKVLGNPYPLQQELTETWERLDRLIQAEAQEDEPAQKRRLQEAIRQHRKKIQQLEKSLQK